MRCGESFRVFFYGSKKNSILHSSYIKKKILDDIGRLNLGYIFSALIRFSLNVKILRVHCDVYLFPSLFSAFNLHTNTCVPFFYLLFVFFFIPSVFFLFLPELSHLRLARVSEEHTHIYKEIFKE